MVKLSYPILSYPESEESESVLVNSVVGTMSTCNITCHGTVLSVPFYQPCYFSIDTG